MIEETGRGGAVLRRGEAAGEDPEHLGCQDHGEQFREQVVNYLPKG